MHSSNHTAAYPSITVEFSCLQLKSQTQAEVDHTVAGEEVVCVDDGGDVSGDSDIDIKNVSASESRLMMMKC